MLASAFRIASALWGSAALNLALQPGNWRVVSSIVTPFLTGASAVNPDCAVLRFGFP